MILYRGILPHIPAELNFATLRQSSNEKGRYSGLFIKPARRGRVAVGSICKSMTRSGVLCAPVALVSGGAAALALEAFS